jgi:hypothetical protein
MGNTLKDLLRPLNRTTCAETCGTLRILGNYVNCGAPPSGLPVLLRIRSIRPGTVRMDRHARALRDDRFDLNAD